MGKQGKAPQGGFGTWPLDALKKHVVDLSVNLDDAYREPADSSSQNCC